MTKIKLKPGMTKREFQIATGLTVEYRDKGKTGISFKFAEGYAISYDYALYLRDDYLRRFAGCKVKIVRRTNRNLHTELIYHFVVRVIVPVA